MSPFPLQTDLTQGSSDGQDVTDEITVLSTTTGRITIYCTEQFDANQQYTAIEEIEAYSVLLRK